MAWINLGTRNKPTCWEYGSAYSFLHSHLPMTKFNIPLFFAYGEGETNQHCHDAEAIDADIKIMREEFETGLYTDNFFDQMIENYMERCRVFDSPLPNLENLNDEELAELYQRYTIAIAEPNPAMLIALYTMYLDDHYTEELYNALSAKEKEDPEYILQTKATLLTTRETSFAQLEEDRLYNLIQPYLAKNSNLSFDSLKDYCVLHEVDKEISKIVEEFGWFHMEYHKEPATKDDYLNYLWNIVSQPKDSNRAPYETRNDIKRQQDEFFKCHPHAARLRNLTHVLQRFAYILDHTKMVVIKGIYRSRPIYKEMGKRLGIEEIDFRYLVLPETLELLNNNRKADQSIIEARKKYRAVLMQNGTISVFGGEEEKSLAEKLLAAPSPTGDKEVKGIVGYPGIIEGKVTVVSSINDRDKFKRGDILVTHDGSAELTIFLKEAGAIVTDEGGMICHASIIAREMKTPCIVATKNATRVFKDGDAVEVNTNTRTVKIIA